MSLPIYQRVAVTDAGDVIPGAEYTVINENTGVAQPIYSDRTGATLLTPPYFADSVGTIQFFIAQGTTFRVAASGGVGTYTDRYVYGVAEAVLVQADGNVGINVTNPIYTLEVQGEAGVELYNTTGGGDVLSFRPSLGDAQKYNMSISSYDHSSNGIGPADGLSINGRDGVSISTGSDTTRTERMRITDAGLVGIGEIDPTGYWSQANQMVMKAGNCGLTMVSSTAGNARLVFTDTKSLTAGLNDGGMIAYSHTSDLMIFQTAGSERMRIDSAGKLLVNITNPATGFQFQVDAGSGNARFTNVNTGGSTFDVFRFNGGLVGSITTNGLSTSYNTSSDYRLKENDVPMTGATERVKALRPINFAWKVDGSRVDGFFAHELAEVVPEAATGTKDAMMDEQYEVTPAVYEDVTTPAVDAVLDENGVVITEAVEESTESVLVTEAVMGTRSVPDYQGIDQSKLVPLLTATIQELIARIEALEAGA